MLDARTVKPELKMSYNFAMCSFSRMYGVRHVQCSNDIHRFCILWAESTLTPPAESLTKVDFYFRDLWTKSILT
jgi:hypothetical protein